MPKVFISYRRSDAREEAVRIADEIADEFGPSAVFLDTETMAPGETFPSRIETNIGASTHVLVLIGPDWLVKNPETGQPRLHDQGDWVRREIGLALSQGKTVIPVLVKNAQMPERTELPLDLRELVDQNAVDLRPSQFRSGLQGLIDRMRDQSALSAAGIVLIASVIAGVLWFFIDQTNDFFRMTLRALQLISFEMSGVNTPDQDGYRNCGLPEDKTITAEDLHCRVSFLLHAGVAGPVSQAVLHVFNEALYFAIVAFGALTAARGYSGMGGDRLFPAVVLAAVFFILGDFLMLALLEGATWVQPDAVYQPLRAGCVSAGFVLGLLLPLRRRLNLQGWEVAAAISFVFLGVTVTQYVLYQMPISVAWLQTVFSDPKVFRVLGTADGASTLHLNQVLEHRPICWPVATQTCSDMAKVFREITRFTTVMALACLVLHWRFSIIRILAFWVIVLTISVIVVNLMAAFEGSVLNVTRIFVDPGLPQALLYTMIAYLLAKFRIRRPVRSRKQSTA